jgi:hypothetical protein
MQRGRIFDCGTDHAPPQFEPRLGGGSSRLLQFGIPEHDGVKRPQDLWPVYLCPSDRVGMPEGPVLGVDAVNLDSGLQRARDGIALRSDIVAGKELNGGGRD